MSNGNLPSNTATSNSRKERIMGLAEGQIGVGAVGEGITYDGVSSCLTVTCLLEDGTYVGGHLSLQKQGSGLDSTEVLPAMKQLIGCQKPMKVTISGVLDQWSPAFFDLPFISASGDFNYGEDVSVGDTSYAVLSALDASGATVEQNTATGTFNVKL
jgi:hypothetical protein